MAYVVVCVRDLMLGIVVCISHVRDLMLGIVVCISLCMC